MQVPISYSLCRAHHKLSNKSKIAVNEVRELKLWPKEVEVRKFYTPDLPVRRKFVSPEDIED
jgi:hypothetical protein